MIEAEKKNGKDHASCTSKRLISKMEAHAKWILETISNYACLCDSKIC